MIRVFMTTVMHVRRVIVVPLEEFFANVVESGVTLCTPLMLLPYYADMLVEEACQDLVGELICIPDLDTLKQLPYNPKQAIVFVHMHSKELDPLPTLCPRSVLQTAIRNAKEDFGLEIMVGFETEFVILKDFESSGDRFIPLDDHLYAEAYSTYTISSFFEDANEALADLGVEVLALHSEAGMGMFEIATGTGDPLTAVDKLVLTREVLYELAAKRGWRLTLCPKIYDDRAGTGQHVHMSIWKDGKNLVPDDSVDNEYSVGHVAQQYIAGILKHLGGIALLLQPTANSFRRMQLHFLCGSYRCWGHNNRDVSVRVCVNIPKIRGTRYCSNFEIKCVDGTCNPYYAVAALIASGLDGLRNKTALEPPLNKPADENTPCMPTQFEDAAQQFASDTVVHELLGENRNSILALRKAEQLYFKDKSVEFVKRTTIEHF